MFVPEESFEQLVKKLIRTLEEPSLQCSDAVYDELHQIIDSIDMPELSRYDNLRERIREVVHSLLMECRIPARQMIVNLIAMEQSYINTSHPDFLGGGKAIQRVLMAKARKQLQEQGADGTAPRDIPPEYHHQYAAQYAAQAQRERDREMRRKEEEAVKKMNQAQKEMEDQKRSESHRAAVASQQASQGSQDSGVFSGLVTFFKGAPTTTPTSPTAVNIPSSVKTASQPMAKSVSEILPLAISSSSSGARSNSSASSAAAPVPGPRMNATPMSITSGARSQDDFQSDLIKLLLESYYNIVKNNVRDKIPKTIMHMMVNSSKERLQSELVKQLYRDDLMDYLLQESSEVAERRDRAQMLVEVLQKAQGILNEIVETV